MSMSKVNRQKYRIEEDSLGKKNIPSNLYYGIQTVRALENFQLNEHKVYYELVYNLLFVKKACAIANQRIKLLSSQKTKAILQAIDEAIKGKFSDQFPVEAIQGGALTSLNMNINEVIANRSLEILGRKKGEYQYLHPNDDVNMSQSTNDVVPTAIRLTSIQFSRLLTERLKGFSDSLENKAYEFKNVMKLGRTHLQDAVPITLGEEFKAYAAAIKNKIEKLRALIRPLSIINLGGTAIGTKLNAPGKYIKIAVYELSKILGYKLKSAADLIAATQDQTIFCEVSSVLKSLSIALSKIASDLRLLSSGPVGGIGEIILPAVQPGSSIMPGKVNPVIPELINQIYFIIAGNDLAITLAVEKSRLELNVMMPTIADKLISSYKLLIGGIEIFNKKCIRDITVSRERCRGNLEKSTAFATKLVPIVGYKKATEIVKLSFRTGRTIKDIAINDFKIPSKVFSHSK